MKKLAVALLVVMLTFTACKDSNNPEESEPQTYLVEYTINFSGGTGDIQYTDGNGANATEDYVKISQWTGSVVLSTGQGVWLNVDHFIQNYDVVPVAHGVSVTIELNGEVWVSDHEAQTLNANAGYFFFLTTGGILP